MAARLHNQTPLPVAHLLTKNTAEFSGKKKVRRMGQKEEKDKKERAMGLGRRTREEIVKWN